MSKKSHFRESFKKQHGKLAQLLLKCASQHLSHIHWSVSRQLSWKKFLLLTFQFLGLLVIILAADDKCPVLNRDNSTKPSQMQLSQKKTTFSEVFATFLKCRLNFQHFEKKKKTLTLIDFVFLKLRTSKTCVDKCLKSSISVDHSTSNMVNVPKHCRNLHQSTFIWFIDQCQGNWAGKSLSYWQPKSWDRLLTHWLPITGILFLIETI